MPERVVTPLEQALDKRLSEAIDALMKIEKCKTLRSARVIAQQCLDQLQADMIDKEE